MTSERARQLFDLMHRVVDGEISTEEAVLESKKIEPIPTKKTEPSAVVGTNFVNGMSAHNEWEKEQERIEDDRRQAA